MLTYQTKILLNNETLKTHNVKENDIIYVETLPDINYNNALQGFDFATTTADHLQRYILNHVDLLNYVKKTIPKLHEAVIYPSDILLEQFLKPIRDKAIRQRQKMIQMKEEEKLRKILHKDPFNVEAQRKLEELIKKKNLDENMKNAYEFKPELFGRVYMLYINVSINKIKLKAFVDTGAQMTIMSATCAEKCGLMRLLDKRYSGIARGVGTAKILGRVHLVQIQIGKSFFHHNLSVLNQKNDIDLILGLDFLKGHQVKIDLEKNKFLVGKEDVKFLGEKDIPKIPFNAQMKEGSQSKSLNWNQKIDVLVKLGVTKDIALQALKEANGNVEVAASLIFESFQNNKKQ